MIKVLGYTRICNEGVSLFQLAELHKGFFHKFSGIGNYNNMAAGFQNGSKSSGLYIIVVINITVFIDGSSADKGIIKSKAANHIFSNMPHCIQGREN